MTDSDARGGLAIGDFAPNFVLPDASGKVTMLLERTRGRPIALVLLPADLSLAQQVALLSEKQPDFEAAGVDLMAISGASVDALGGSVPPFHLWSDTRGKVLESYREALKQAGIGPIDPNQVGLTVLALDPNQRIEAVFRAGPSREETEKACGEALAVLRQGTGRLAAPADRVCKTLAPILVLRQLLAPAASAALAALDVKSGSDQDAADPWPNPALDAAQAALGLSGAGRSLAAMDRAVARDLQITIGQRLAVQLEKAFQFRGFHLLPPRIVDISLGVAATVRLASLSGWPARVRFVGLIGIGDAAQAEPGLSFPEYSGRVHRLGLGDALMFSTSVVVVNHGRSGEKGRALLLAVARD